MRFNYCIFIIPGIIIIQCQTKVKLDIIHDKDVAAIVERTLGYEDSALGLNQIFYKSQKYKIIRSEYLNREIKERHPKSQKVRLNKSRDTTFFSKYLSKGVDQFCEKGQSGKDESEIYTSDIYNCNDTLVFCIAKPHFNAICFYVTRKPGLMLKHDVILVY